MPFDTPLVVELRPSTRLRLWLAGLAFAAGSAVLQSGLPATAKGCAGFVLLAGWGRGQRQHRRKWRKTRLAQDGAGRWAWYREGAWRDARLAAAPVTLPGAILLELQPEQGGRKVRWLLLHDMMRKEDFRRLCVRARLDAHRLALAEAVGGKEADAPRDRTEVSGPP